MTFNQNGFLGGEAEQIARAIQEKHAEFFKFCEKINRLAHVIQSELFTSVPADDARKQYASVLFIRILEGSQAAIMLAGRGFRSEPWVTIRVVFEALCLLVIARDNQELFEYYMKTDECNRLKLMRDAEKNPNILPLLNSYATKEVMAEVDKRIRDESIKPIRKKCLAEAAGMGALYFTLYRYSSAFVHSGPDCWKEYKGEEGEIIFGPRDDGLRIALLQITDFLISAFTNINMLFDLQRNSDIAEMKQRWVELEQQERIRMASKTSCD
jgi:hypothetical protein